MIVLDLGGVLVASDAVMTAVAERLGVSRPALEAVYYGPREAYDLGGADLAYWTAVGAALGATISDGDAAELTAIDATKWADLPAESAEFLAALGDRRTAVLSNAPAHLARTVRTATWSQRFETLVFSAEVGLVKPDPAIYAAADRAYGTTPGECTFFDDKPVNVEAARAHGWDAHVWTGPADALARL
ncbi:HAD-IA family hydrolase [Actinomycetospora termitidis]|uniref:HAD-IA family hydrolase n=1 Tax=Actinomycetospora termitidis TaxID=3053470 RepID=A0ABT7MF97_9PSEU|nr:HAD-IA family hydrolase [Actinomycetospora sp. Odt1-22]MDL5159320.1 HAD-IA family hydrolase [Actinomycetospora sp. Odt1-22]